MSQKLPKTSKVRPLSAWHDWVSLLLMAGTLGIAVYSINQSKWIDPQPALMSVFGFAVVTGLVLSFIPGWAAHPLALGGGLVITMWQMKPVLPWTGDIVSLLRVLLNLVPSQSTIPFAVFLTIFTWVMAYLATWYLLREQNAWVGVLPGAAALLVNLSNLGEEQYRFFLFYLLAAGLLIGQTALGKQARQLKKSGARYGMGNTIRFMTIIVVLMLSLTSVTWALPEIKTKHLQEFLNTKALAKAIDNNQINIFASVPAKWSVLKEEHQADLSFGPPNLSGEAQFTITADKPLAYWRIRRYDVYTSTGWTSSPTSEVILNLGAAVGADSLPANRTEFTYKVVSKIKTNVLLSAGEFVSSDIQVAVQTVDSTSDIVAVSSPSMLTPNDSYTARTVVNAATPKQLAQALIDYSEDITEHYLQLPAELPRRVRSLTQIITRSARNPYDKAVAIVRYLSQFNYIREGTTAPPGYDAVDYFLTMSQSGNCNNFATTMTIMLRAIGIPARLSTGYLLQEKDASGALVLRAVDYHARPEVYFPGYGWVEFEATPVRQPTSSDTGERVVGIIDSNVGPAISTNSGATNEPVTSPATTDLQASTADKPSPAGFEDFVDSGAPAFPAQPTWPGYVKTISLILLPLLLLVILYRWYRRFKSVDTPTKAYARMCALARLVRMAPRPHQTPLEYSALMATAFPAQSQAFTELTWAYLRSEYGQENLGEEGRESLRRSWQKVYRALLGRLLAR